MQGTTAFTNKGGAPLRPQGVPPWRSTPSKMALCHHCFKRSQRLKGHKVRESMVRWGLRLQSDPFTIIREFIPNGACTLSNGLTAIAWVTRTCARLLGVSLRAPLNCGVCS